MMRKQVLQFVGSNGEQAVSTTVTQQQIDQLETLRCDLVTDDGEPVAWADVNNPAEPRTLFQFIMGDRKHRVDEQTPMANQTPLAVATVIDDTCVRLEFYEGYDTLKKTHDLRSEELRGVELKDFIKTAEQILEDVA